MLPIGAITAAVPEQNASSEENTKSKSIFCSLTS